MWQPNPLSIDGLSDGADQHHVLFSPNRPDRRQTIRPFQQCRTLVCKRRLHELAQLRHSNLARCRCRIIRAYAQIAWHKSQTIADYPFRFYCVGNRRNTNFTPPVAPILPPVPNKAN